MNVMLAGFADELVKVARVPGHKKMWRRALEMFITAPKTSKTQAGRVFHGSRDLPGVVASGKVKPTKRTQDVFWAIGQPQKSYFERGVGATGGGVISTRGRSGVRPNVPGYGEAGGHRGAYRLQKGDYIVAEPGSLASMREGQRKHRMRPMLSEVMIAAEGRAWELQRAAKRTSKFRERPGTKEHFEKLLERARKRLAAKDVT